MNPASPSLPTSTETLSALLDGELQGDDFARALAACEQDPALLMAWRDYHLIGDILRAPASELPATAHVGQVGHIARDHAFLERLQARLAVEAAPVRPMLAEPLAPMRSQAPANDSRFSWPWLASLAGVLVLGSLGWNLWMSSGDAGPALAQGQTPASSVLVQSAQGVIERDARLQALLDAHRDWGGPSVLQTPSGFLRNATFEAPAPDR